MRANLVPDRAIDKNAIAWIRWLETCGLPSEHIAIVMNLEPSRVSAWLESTSRFLARSEAARMRELWAAGRSLRSIARELGRSHSAICAMLGRSGAVGREPASPPRQSHKIQLRGIRPIIGATGTKVRRLHELRYSSQRIAAILALDPAAVADFIRRTRPILGDALVRPRSVDEQARLKRRRHKPPAKPRHTPPEIDPAEAWRYLDDVGPDGRPDAIEPPAVDPIAAAETSPPDVGTPPAPSTWSGRSDWRPRGEQHGSCKLTEADVREILRRHAGGSSIYALAKEYKVNQGTIRAIVRGATWAHLERPLSPAPGSARSV